MVHFSNLPGSVRSLASNRMERWHSGCINEKGRQDCRRLFIVMDSFDDVR